MKRIDKIIFNALGDMKINNYCAQTSAHNIVTEPGLPIEYNNEQNDELVMANSGENHVDTVSPRRAIAGTMRESPSMSMINAIDKNAFLESPIAPLYSPLTPLLCREATYRKEHFMSGSGDQNSSPIRPMSPKTLELFQNLTGVISPFQVNEEFQENEPNNIKENQDQVSDLIVGTDADYIANSDEDSSDEHSTLAGSEPIKVVALVHKSGELSTKQTSKISKPFYGHNNNLHIVSNENILSNDSERENDTVISQILNEDDVTECSSSNATVNNEQRETDLDHLLSSKGRPKKGRKRKHDSNTLAQAKQRKYVNLLYHTKNRQVLPKSFQDFTCNCVRKCFLMIPKNKREEEFKKYVTLGSYEAQLLYIVNSVKESPKKRAYTIINGSKSGKKRPRQFTRRYTICNIEVCREMFINTFQITPKKVDVSLRKYRSGKMIKDQRGQVCAGWNKTNEEDIDFVKSIINALPKYESHYRREKNSGCHYLKLGMTISKIYDLYAEKFKAVYGDEKKLVSLSTLKRVFNTNFNLRCKSLKKDTCSRCDILTNSIKKCTTHEEQDKLKNEKDEHLKRAENLRKNMNEDLKRAKIDEFFECLTFDLEKTLPLPRIPTSIVFYKRQLWLYNCGIHVGSNNSGHCYVWIEGEAGRGAQEVGSCLVNFIKNKLDSKIKHLVLWSDCCGGQNRNIKIVLMLKVILNTHPTLRTITLKYLESGHTFLPNDTDFSKIETQLKYHERIYTAEEYLNVIKSAKKKNPLQVYRMEKKDFLGTKNLEKKIVNRKVFVNKNKTNWLKTKEILLARDNQSAIFMKTALNEAEFQELNIEKKSKGKILTISENDFSLLWPNGKEIPQAKLDDLKSMFDLIPKDCLDFYKSLRGNASIVDDIDGFGGSLDFVIENEEDEYATNETDRV